MIRFLKFTLFIILFACFLLWITGYGYIFYGINATYLRFEKTAQIDDARFFYNDTVFPSEKPFFLSGGIGLEDISKLKAILNTSLPLYAIDVNSKFESVPGIKKIDVLKQFKKELYEL